MHGLGQKQSKLIKSVTSCHRHLVLNNPKIYHVSANTSLNRLKVQKLKLQDIMQETFENNELPM